MLSLLIKANLNVRNVPPIAKDTMGDIVTPANPTERIQNKDHMLKYGYNMVFCTPNDTETNWKKGTHGNQSRVLLQTEDLTCFAAEHTSVHKVFITNVNNSVYLNKVKYWLSKKIKISEYIS